MLSVVLTQLSFELPNQADQLLPFPASADSSPWKSPRKVFCLDLHSSPLEGHLLSEGYVIQGTNNLRNSPYTLCLPPALQEGFVLNE